jgi:hypothetical protein
MEDVRTKEIHWVGARNSGNEISYDGQESSCAYVAVRWLEAAQAGACQLALVKTSTAADLPMAMLGAESVRPKEGAGRLSQIRPISTGSYL